jgi:hypothetical protein
MEFLIPNGAMALANAFRVILNQWDSVSSSKIIKISMGLSLVTLELYPI